MHSSRVELQSIPCCITHIAKIAHSNSSCLLQLQDIHVKRPRPGAKACSILPAFLVSTFPVPRESMHQALMFYFSPISGPYIDASVLRMCLKRIAK